jgi:hypothetical protein
MLTYAGGASGGAVSPRRMLRGDRVYGAGTQFTSFTGTIYLLYWYKSTNTDLRSLLRGGRNSVYLHYWYKSTNTDATRMQAVEHVYLLYWYKYLLALPAQKCKY